MSPITAFLADTAATLDHFVAVLRREAEALSGQDPEALAGIADEKGQVSGAISALWQRLCQALEQPGLKPDAVKQLLADRGDREALLAWDRVNRLSGEARQLNQDNGALIRQQLQHTSKAIEILQTIARQNTTYGPDGMAEGDFPFRRTIDKA